jgi:hypothetical protein
VSTLKWRRPSLTVPTNPPIILSISLGLNSPHRRNTSIPLVFCFVF